VNRGEFLGNRGPLVCDRAPLVCNGARSTDTRVRFLDNRVLLVCDRALLVCNGVSLVDNCARSVNRCARLVDLGVKMASDAAPWGCDRGTVVCKEAEPFVCDLRWGWGVFCWQRYDRCFLDEFGTLEGGNTESVRRVRSKSCEIVCGFHEVGQ